MPQVDPTNEALREREDRFRSLAENAAEAIVTIDAEDRIVFANRAAERVFGYSGDELLHLNFTGLIPERFRASHRAGIQHHVRTGAKRIPWDGIDLVGLRRDGSEIPLEVTFGEHITDDRHYFTGIMRDITERHRSEEERKHLLERERSARAEAEEANRTKSEFLATMSHEIRTPINAIIGYSELLELGITGSLNDRQKEQLGRIRSSSAHLLTLVEDILDLAKVEAGRITVEHEGHLVMSAVAGALSLTAQRAEEAGIAIRDECSHDGTIAYIGDGDRVRQILVNLLSNAIKFTQPGGTITLRCSMTADPPSPGLPGAGPWTCISVQDTGSGIAPQDAERVFRPFMQVESGLTRNRGGTGLGLTISRELARLMDGDLTLASEPGTGSTFTIWLPHPDAMPPEPDRAVLKVREKGSAPRSLAEVGMVLQEAVDDLLKAHAERIRSDPLIPAASDAGQADLEDHAGTYLMDLAQTLVVLETSEEDPVHLVRDGTEIQRLISSLHGAQRARLGWNEEALRREWALLREGVHHAIRDRIPSSSGVNLDTAFATIDTMLDFAEHISRRGMQRALSPTGAYGKA